MIEGLNRKHELPNNYNFKKKRLLKKQTLVR